MIRFKGKWGAVDFPSPNELGPAEVGLDIDNIKGSYHTHWKRPGSPFYSNEAGDRVNPKTYKGKIISGVAARYHGGYDLDSSYPSFVINRFDGSFNSNYFDVNYSSHISSSYRIINPRFSRFFLQWPMFR